MEAPEALERKPCVWLSRQGKGPRYASSAGPKPRFRRGTFVCATSGVFPAAFSSRIRVRRIGVPDAGCSMRVVVLLLMLLCAVAGQAHAFGEPNCEIYWKAFTLPQEPAPDDPAAPAGGGAVDPFSSPTYTGRLLLALTIVPAPGEYLYGPESTDGLPTRMDVTVAELSAFPMKALTSRQIAGLMLEKGDAVPVRMPAPVLKKETVFAAAASADGSDGELPVYPGPVTFWAEVPVSVTGFGGVAAQAILSGLLCSPVSCTPASGELNLAWSALELKSFPLAEEQPWWGTYSDGKDVFVEPPEGVLPSSGTEPEQGSGQAQSQASSQIPGQDAPRYSSVVSSLEPSFFIPSLEVQYLGEALLFGLLAGLLLNLMPCVLPVVSLKFSALMAVTAMTDKQEQARCFRNHCIIFALGIMAWFVILAFLLGVAGWAWGELFQQPVIIVGLGMLLFLLGLSLFGVYSLPILNLKIASDSHPHWQSFASGLLATLLATPCSGPLLGGVLAWAIRQPLPVLTMAVTSVGLGMSLPYCVLAFCPRLVHLLPRPGTWTIRLEQLLGFFLMGSVVYLTTLLPENWVPAFLFNLFAVAFAAWLWGQIGHLGASRLRRGVSRAVALLVLVSAGWLAYISVNPDSTWEAFDPDVFAEALGNEPLLLDFTADWCPSCKALEHTTLNKARMDDLRRTYNVRTIRVDLTRDADAGNALLKALDSTSIPVLALFPKGEKALQPVVLRDLVTPRQLLEAASATYGDTGFERLRRSFSQGLSMTPAEAHEQE